MTTITTVGKRTAQPAFLACLHANGPSADRAGNMDLYGWLVGSWDLDVTRFLPDGTTRRRSGEWHVGWVLEGRAIQDVWVVPPHAGPNAPAMQPPTVTSSVRRCASTIPGSTCGRSSGPIR